MDTSAAPTAEIGISISMMELITTIPKLAGHLLLRVTSSRRGKSASQEPKSTNTIRNAPNLSVVSIPRYSIMWPCQSGLQSN
jgi:hypothetical protein